MTIMGLSESVVAPLVRAVAADLDIAEVEDRFARAAWSTISEPGDSAAGVLIGTLGAGVALERVIAHVDPAVLAKQLADDGVDSTPQIWEDALKRWTPRVKSAEVLLSLKQAARFGARLVVPGDQYWPVGVDDLGAHAPHVLWARGDITRLAALDRSIALVGARAATGYGEHVTVEASSGLVDRGFAIVSGAAYGIDGIAHRSALASQGTTIAVLAGGLDRFYPSGHEQLLTRIVDHGVVLAEVPCGTAPTKWRFLQRNRLIAALAQATVVIEAGWRSGSINTANHARDLDRPVGAVPGPVTSAASAGCHKLIRDFAVCVTTPEEMAELMRTESPALFDLGAEAGDGDGNGHVDRDRESESSSAPSSAPPPPAPPAPHDFDGTRVRLLDAMADRGGRSADKIARLSGLALDRVKAELGLLELEGLVIERPAGWTKRVQKKEQSH
jgi:DNA processing protein